MRTAMVLCIAALVLLLTFASAQIFDGPLNAGEVAGQSGNKEKPSTGAQDPLNQTDPSNAEGEGGQKTAKTPETEPIGWTSDCILALSYDKETVKDDKDGVTHIKDLSGNGNHGTIYGAKLKGGVSKDCLLFDGIDDYIDFGNVCNITKNFTIATWVRMERKNDNSKQAIIAKVSGVNEKQYALATHETTGVYWLEQETRANNSGVHDPTSPPSFGKWEHIAVTVESNHHVVIYRNGKKSADGRILSETGSSLDNLNIGRFGGTYNNFYLKGCLDETAVWDRALTAEEIADLFATSQKRKSYCQIIEAAARNK